MHRKKKHILLWLLLFLCTALGAQEICDNALDDDNDGLIDLNDDDCLCNGDLPDSLVPNPSFEEQTCCPNANAQLNCAVGWVQASAPTTDYVHTCGNYLGNTNIPAFAPLPFPDGEGAVGFRDGENGVGANYKEYVGACLLEPMIVGADYRLDFYVGFRDNVIGSTQLNMAIFGSTSCGNLPFGNGNFLAGCPLNSGGYTQLGELSVSGSNNWVNVVFEFQATQPYEVLVLGPACAANPNYEQNPYFYLDGLTVAASTDFGIPLESVTGDVCQDNLTLTVEDNPDYTYQWYINGVAIIAEESPSLILTSEDPEGLYSAVINTPDGCLFTTEYFLNVPSYSQNVETVICEDEYYLLNGDTLRDAGSYQALMTASNGCDSLVNLTLGVGNHTYADFEGAICLGDLFEYYDVQTDEPGEFIATTTNYSGCDSIISVTVINVSEGIEVVLPERVEVLLGQTVDVEPESFDFGITAFTWTDPSGEILSETPRVDDYYTLESTYLFLETTDTYGCMFLDSVFVEVLPFYDLYIPNVFSPDNSGFNDYFKFYPASSLASVTRFSIYDRWGGLMYEENNITDFDSFLGWDGRVEGKYANPGVYVYLIEAVFLDGEQRQISGDVTLVR